MLIVERAGEQTQLGASEYGFRVYKGITSCADSETEDQDLDKLNQLISEIKEHFTMAHDYGTGAQMFIKGIVQVVIVEDQGFKGVYAYDFNTFCDIICRIREEMQA